MTARRHALERCPPAGLPDQSQIWTTRSVPPLLTLPLCGSLATRTRLPAPMVPSRSSPGPFRDDRCGGSRSDCGQRRSPGKADRLLAGLLQSRRAPACRRVSRTPAANAATPLTATNTNLTSGTTGSGRASSDSATSTGGAARRRHRTPAGTAKEATRPVPAAPEPGHQPQRQRHGTQPLQPGEGRRRPGQAASHGIQTVGHQRPDRQRGQPQQRRHRHRPQPRTRRRSRTASQPRSPASTPRVNRRIPWGQASHRRLAKVSSPEG
jgi:hypothetical protein